MFTWLCRYEKVQDSIDRLRLEFHEGLKELRMQMAHDAAALVSAFNAATDEVANDLNTLKDQLRAAVADKDEAVRTAVEEALSGFDAPLARLQALGADETDPVPGEDVPADNGGTEADGGTVDNGDVV